MPDIDPGLLDILVCPQCRAQVAYDYEGSRVVCTASACGLAFRVDDGIPVMLLSEAIRP